MSARVVRGNPTKKPHTAAKLGLAAVLFVAAAVLMPLAAWAAQPAVQSPTGPMSGGMFTGTYTFDTFIPCSGGSFSGSYANNLAGTHTFTFLGAPDGSLLVSIDGGGAQLISSCGSPFATPQTTVASYTVTKGTPPPPTPTPTPTPAPTPVPTPAPTPAPAPTSISGTSRGSTPQPPRQQGGLAPPSTAPTPTSAVVAPEASSPPSTASSSPTPSAAPVIAGTNSKLPPSSPSSLNLGWLVWTLPILAVIAAAILAFKVTRLRHYLADGALGLKLATGPHWLKARMLLRRLTRGHDLARRKGLSHARHSGKILAHHHTSYPALVFLVMLGGVVLAGYSTISLAASSDQLVSLTVLGPPPTSSPVITSPVTGDTVSSSVITVRGTCEIGMLVGLYRNGGASGSVACDGAGMFAVLTTVVAGVNQFMAYTIDGLGQLGPASDPVNITYVAPPAPSANPTPAPSAASAPGVSTKTPMPRPSATGGRKPAPIFPPLLITTDELYYVGVTVNQALTVSARLTGGAAPYTVDWDWGDGAHESMYVVAGPIQATHSYTRAGSYKLLLRATDSQKRQAVSTTAIIVNGGPAPIAVTTPASRGLDGLLAIAWPLWVALILMLASFWLGERYRENDRPVPILIKPQLIG